jgi:diacylglycerol kinase (ATP)
MRVRIVINPAAGNSEPVLSVLNGVFDPAGIEWDVVLTHKAGDGATAAREATDQGFDLVGAYGGDGTVAEVASGLAEGGPPMLLLPGGTGNALAADLGIPPKLADAAALAVAGAGEIRRVDMGRAGERWFVLRLTMGFEADVVGATTREMKDSFGWLAYAMSALQALSEPPMATYSVTVDGETVECEGLAAVVCNSASIGVGGIRLADDVDVSDGVLDVAVLQSLDLMSLLGSAADAAQGQELRMLSRWRGAVIHVESSPVLEVLADGEEAGRTPVDATIVPGALGVVVPKTVA